MSPELLTAQPTGGSSPGSDASVYAGVDSAPARVPGFSVRLPQFEGPFDLLLALIARRRLDVTELALAEVTDEFLAAMRESWELEHASEFLVVAATLVALKAHRLLPHPEGEEDPEDLELIEARDLLFARLLQYRAFKEAAALMRQREEEASRSYPRVVGLPPHLAGLLPRLVAHIDPQLLARTAAAVFSRPAEPVVHTVHLHEPVPVAEQLSVMTWRLRSAGTLTFTELVDDVAELADAQRRRAVLVARFLGILILHREGAVDLAQEEALGEITVRWTGESESLAGVLADGDGADQWDDVRGASAATAVKE